MAEKEQAAFDPPRSEDGTALRRYERPHEHSVAPEQGIAPNVIAFGALAEAMRDSGLSAGSQTMLLGLLRVGRTAMFPGGGTGIEYGSLLKTAARPDLVGLHVREAAAYLHDHAVNLLLVPGISGYPVGSMYSAVSGIPALLLKKQKHVSGMDSTRYPAGSFVIPSYTGEGDVVMSADLAATEDLIASIVAPQLAAQSDADQVQLSVRVAGADDIIDKATMSQAVSESAVVIGQASVERYLARHRQRTGDTRPISADVRVVAWVTPLIKVYNRPQEQLHRWFGITPFAGLNVTSVHLEPPAIGIDGLGVVAFAGPAGLALL